MNLLTRIGGVLFGDKGLAGGVVETLQGIGLLKDPKEAQAALERMRALEQEDERIDNDKLKTVLADVAGARGMQVAALQQDDWFAKRFIYWYAIGVSTLSFIYFFVVTLVELSDAQRTIANIILGFLLANGLGVIIGFFYGTSYGTLKKNKQIEDLSKR